MGLDSLPKAGIGFRSSSGSGNLKYKLARLTAHQGGEFGNLRNNQKKIFEALDKYSGVIKSRGGLNRLQQKEIIHSIKSQDSELTYDDKKDLKKIVGYYSRNKKSAETNKESLTKSSSPVAFKSRSDILGKAMKKTEMERKQATNDRPDKVPLQLRINRADSEFNQDKVKNNRASATQMRLEAGATGVTSPQGPTLKPGENSKTMPGAKSTPPAPAPHHEQIRFN